MLKFCSFVALIEYVNPVVLPFRITNSSKNFMWLLLCIVNSTTFVPVGGKLLKN